MMECLKFHSAHTNLNGVMKQGTIATLPMSLGGLGVRSAVRTSGPAHWASWADCSWSRSVTQSQAFSLGWVGFGCHRGGSWRWEHDQRPREPEHFEPGCTRDGWQHEAEDLFARMDDPSKALLRSQGGPGAGLALSTCPVSRLTTFTPQLFRVVLLRRLHLPLTVRNCRCGRPLDSRGHHRAACARVGILGGRGWAVENAAARICREAGGRVTTQRDGWGPGPGGTSRGRCPETGSGR